MPETPDAAPGTGRRYPLWLIILVIIAALIAAGAIGKWRASAGAVLNAKSGRPAAAVNAAKVSLADMPVTVSAVGTVTPIDTATVKAQISGNISQIMFKEGQQVHNGQVIAQIDPRPFRLTLQSAEANLARDAATLANARRDLARYQTLAAQDSIAHQQFDTQAATVKQEEGVVAADRAAVGTARLNLSYTAITAPVAGQIGLKQVTIGNYVGPGDANGVAIITRTDPIDIEFSVPQSQLGAIRKAAAGGTGLAVTAFDQDGTTVIAHGRFGAFDNQIATATGTVNAKARFDNPGNAASQPLFPNQFVNVSILVDTLHQVPVVPVAAVRHGAPGDFVFVVQVDQTVKLTVVKLGPSDGTNIAILSGLGAGQTVVTEGADGLDNGSKVRLPHGGSAGGNAAPDAAPSGHHHHQSAQ